MTMKRGTRVRKFCVDAPLILAFYRSLELNQGETHDDNRLAVFGIISGRYLHSGNPCRGRTFTSAFRSAACYTVPGFTIR